MTSVASFSFVIDSVARICSCPAVSGRVPALLLPPGPTYNHTVIACWICLHLDVVDTEVALHPKPIDCRGVVAPNFRLLSIVTDPHADVILATVTPDGRASQT